MRIWNLESITGLSLNIIQEIEKRELLPIHTNQLGNYKSNRFLGKLNVLGRQRNSIPNSSNKGVEYSL